MNDNTKIFKNSIILYLRLIITSVIGLFCARLVLKSLGASDFGLYSVVGGIVIMINILNTSMTSASHRYIAFELGKGNTEGVNKVFNISFVLHLCLGLVLVILAETLGSYYIHNYLNVPVDRVDDAIFVFRFSVLAAVFSILSIPFQALITALERFSVRASIEIISAMLKMGVVILLLYYSGDRLRLYAVLMTIVIASIALQYILYCRRKFASFVAWNFQRDKSKYIEIVGFSGWVMVGVAAVIGRTQGAALILNLFFGTLLNASFGIASQVNNLILQFSLTLSQTATPQITKSYSSGDSDRTTQLVCYIPKYTFFLMLLPALPILLETNFLLNLWLDKVPEYTVIFCQLMLINALIDSLGTATTAAAHATGRIKHFQTILSTIYLLSLPVAYVLFNLGFPPHTIFVVYIIVTSINVVVRQILLKRLINFDVKKVVKVFYSRILYVAVFVSPLFFVKELFDESMVRFILLSLFSIIWIFVAVYVVGTEQKERSAFWSTVSKRLQRIF